MFDPGRWGLPSQAVVRLGKDLFKFWERFRPCFRTRTRDTSHHAYDYLRGQLTMEDSRNYANIARRLTQTDGQSLQQFMSDSPWRAASTFEQIQSAIEGRAIFQKGGVVILDESADEKAGESGAGAARQYNGHLGKVDVCQVATCLAYAHPASGTWALVDGELFIPEVWFSSAYADQRQQVGIPPEREFLSKPQLGLEMIRRVQANRLPFDLVACDTLYGRNRAFRAALQEARIPYAAQVPANYQVYRQAPKVGLPRKRGKQGQPVKRLQVLSRQLPHEVRALASSRTTVWQSVIVRSTERGALRADFVVQPVWTLTEAKQVRAEWLVIRRDTDARLTFTLLNAPAETSTSQLIESSCHRQITERVYQDAKVELGWDDFQARKYRAWEHHLALTAAALWFIAEVKLTYRETYPRDPELANQLAVAVLPTLSVANVRDLLQAVLPLPQFTPDQARSLVATHLVNRAHATSSRLKSHQNYVDSS